MILRRLPDSRFSVVERGWLGGTAVVIGGGPSLTPEQVELVRLSKHEGGVTGVIAVNDAYLMAPWADILYGADVRWWQWQEKGIPRPLIGLTAEQALIAYRAFPGQRCSIQHGDPLVGTQITDDAVHLLRNKNFPDHGLGLSIDQGALVTGRNSGFQALNLATLAGVKRVLLLGIDGRFGVDGRSHWFGEHPSPMQPEVYEAMRKAFSAAEAAIIEIGVEVINCSPGSGIDSFPKQRLEECL